MPTKANLIKAAASKLVTALDTGANYQNELSALRELLKPVTPKTQTKLEEKVWFTWSGMGQRPVGARTRVCIKRRDGDIKCGCSHYFRWNWEGKEPKANDVVSYSVEVIRK